MNIAAEQNRSFTILLKRIHRQTPTESAIAMGDVLMPWLQGILNTHWRRSSLMKWWFTSSPQKRHFSSHRRLAAACVGGDAISPLRLTSVKYQGRIIYTPILTIDNICKKNFCNRVCVANRYILLTVIIYTRRPTILTNTLETRNKIHCNKSEWAADEIAKVNFFTTTSYTYYKIQ